MELPTTLQGRRFGPEELDQVRALIRHNRGWSRYRLSRELADLWNWRTSGGQLKDMAARTLLLKLHQRELIELPPPRTASPTRSGRAPVGGAPLDECAVEEALKELMPLRVCEVSRPGGREQRRQLEAALHRHHYLGYRSRVGENLQYWVCDRRERPVACMVFGAPAWQCAARDGWIGWSAARRAGGLGAIVNNTRFLIFPWVRVDHLASHVLGRIRRRIRGDWQDKYGRAVWLLETFVERGRFAGTCYRAANWISLGPTKGRGRQGPAGLVSTTIKEVYVLPLHRNFRLHLNPIETNPQCLSHDC